MNNQLSRAFKIIENITKHGVLNIDEIHAHTGIPKSTVFKLLVNLENQGYILRKRSSNQVDHWYLSLKFLEISRSILARISLKDEVNPVLTKLSKEVKEIVQLGVYENKKFIYIDVIKRPYNIIAYLEVGSGFTLNLCAAGLVLGAALPEKEIDEIIKNTNLVKKTPNSIIEPKKIKEMLKKVADDGYAFDDEYYYTGVRCLAAPIYNYENKVIGAINITGHISTMTDKNLEYLKNKLFKASSEASKIMGYKK